MARGFGTTSGSASTDRIDCAYAGHNAQQSWHILAYRNTATDTSAGRMFAKGDAASADRRLFVDTTYRFDVDYVTQAGNWTVTAPSSGAWHSILITLDGSSAANDPVIYIDGSSVTVTETLAPNGALATGSVAYRVGNRTSAVDRVWNGILAEFAVWNRILSSAEVAFLNPASGEFRSPAFIADYVEWVPMRTTDTYGFAGTPTITGTATQTHPTVISPRGPLLEGRRHALVLA